MKRILCFILLFSLLFTSSAYAAPLTGDSIGISAPSAILIEKETGQVIYEKDADLELFPASVTKIMTLLLICEAVESGRINLEDTVTASARAASFGGSCVYLEAGEQMSVSEMIKCIAVVSANDCAVAMAEYLSGSEEQFVRRMNERAAELGMTHTVFTGCTGLFDDGRHHTTARDVAVMSRELIRHDMIKDYTTIWMDSIRGGEFGLSNTNKLVYWYPGCTGLKTGYTSTSLYCLSATAERDGTEFIAVVMKCESADKRNEDAQRLLDYAFANCELCSLSAGQRTPEIPVILGRAERVRTEYGNGDYILIPKGCRPEFELDIPASLPAPVHAGGRVGTLTVSAEGRTLAEIPLCAAEEVARLGFGGIFSALALSLFGV